MISIQKQKICLSMFIFLQSFFTMNFVLAEGDTPKYVSPIETPQNKSGHNLDKSSPFGFDDVDDSIDFEDGDTPKYVSPIETPQNKSGHNLDKSSPFGFHDVDDSSGPMIELPHSVPGKPGSQFLMAHNTKSEEIKKMEKQQCDECARKVFDELAKTVAEVDINKEDLEKAVHDSLREFSEQYRKTLKTELEKRKEYLEEKAYEERWVAPVVGKFRPGDAAHAGQEKAYRWMGWNGAPNSYATANDKDYIDLRALQYVLGNKDAEGLIAQGAITDFNDAHGEIKFFGSYVRPSSKSKTMSFFLPDRKAEFELEEFLATWRMMYQNQLEIEKNNFDEATFEEIMYRYRLKKELHISIFAKALTQPNAWVVDNTNVLSMYVKIILPIIWAVWVHTGNLALIAFITKIAWWSVAITGPTSLVFNWSVQFWLLAKGVRSREIGAHKYLAQMSKEERLEIFKDARNKMEELEQDVQQGKIRSAYSLNDPEKNGDIDPENWEYHFCQAIKQDLSKITKMLFGTQQ